MAAFEKVKKSREELVEKVIKLMNEGKHNNARLWKPIWCPYNPESGVIYRGGNRLRLMVAAEEAGYKDCRWMTFKQMKKAGYYLKKNQSPILCEKWIFKEEIKVRTDDGQEKIEEVELNYPRVYYFYVYNAEQVKNYPPENKRKLNPDTLQLADQLIDSSECPIYELEQDRAYYNHEKDYITLPSRRQFKSAESFVSVLIHEMGHSTGHKDRLNRQFGISRNDLNYAREEMRAEFGAFFFESDLGLNPSGEVLEDHADYLQSWFAGLRRDPNELFRTCADAEKISNRLMGNYKKLVAEKELIQSPEKDLDTKREEKKLPDDMKLSEQPMVTIIWSEHPELEDGIQMPLYEAELLFGRFYKEHKEEGYFKTKFQISYLLHGDQQTYKGRYDIGDEESSIIGHIRDLHEFYRKDPEYQKFLAEKNIQDEENKKMDQVLHVFLPYLQMHNNLSEIEKGAENALGLLAQLEQIQGTSSSSQVAYYKALKEYVNDCRTTLNTTRDQYALPEPPKLEDFHDELKSEIENYKEHVQDEVAQEAASYGMTVEEYAENDWNSPETVKGKENDLGSKNKEMQITQTRGQKRCVKKM